MQCAHLPNLCVVLFVQKSCWKLKWFQISSIFCFHETVQTMVVVISEYIDLYLNKKLNLTLLVSLL